MHPYSLDLRTRVLATSREAGVHRQQVADRFGVSYSFVTKLLRQEREPGSLAPKFARGGPARTRQAAD
jgi:putative transposase